MAIVIRMSSRQISPININNQPVRPLLILRCHRNNLKQISYALILIKA